MEYKLEWACEGFTHPKIQEKEFEWEYWSVNKVACAPEFSYAWLPELWYRPVEGRPVLQPVPGWPKPTDSATRPMFRLPVVDINQVRVW